MFRTTFPEPVFRNYKLRIAPPSQNPCSEPPSQNLCSETQAAKGQTTQRLQPGRDRQLCKVFGESFFVHRRGSRMGGLSQAVHRHGLLACGGDAELQAGPHQQAIAHDDVQGGRGNPFLLPIGALIRIDPAGTNVQNYCHVCQKGNVFGRIAYILWQQIHQHDDMPRQLL